MSASAAAESDDLTLERERVQHHAVAGAHLDVDAWANDPAPGRAGETGHFPP
jgi:hypothetical protein